MKQGWSENNVAASECVITMITRMKVITCKTMPPKLRQFFRPTPPLYERFPDTTIATICIEWSKRKLNLIYFITRKLYIELGAIPSNIIWYIAEIKMFADSKTNFYAKLYQNPISTILYEVITKLRSLIKLGVVVVARKVIYKVKKMKANSVFL